MIPAILGAACFAVLGAACIAIAFLVEKAKGDA